MLIGLIGAAAITDRESWVTDSEFILSDKPHAKGADGSTFAARVLWSRPNKPGTSNGVLNSAPPAAFAAAGARSLGLLA